MTVYAVTYQKDVPDYITRGKRYRATENVTGLGFNTITDNGHAIYCGWTGSSHLDGGSWTRIEEECDMAERITLQPGDYVSTKGLTEDDYHAVARAFMAAGAKDEGDAINASGGNYLGWDSRDDELWHPHDRVMGFTGRHLNPQQVVSATNATKREEKTMEERVTLQSGDYVKTYGMTEDQYHAIAKALSNAGASSGEYPETDFIGDDLGMGWAFGWDGGRMWHGEYPCFKGRELTVNQVINATNAGGTTPDPLTTILEQAAEHESTAKHHAEMHERLMQQAREMLPEGWRLVRAEDMAEAVSVDVGEWMKGSIAPTQDMSDPANWRAGDVLTCINTAKDYAGDFEYGHTYTVAGPVSDSGWIDCKTSRGINNLPADHFRFHHRP